MLPRLLTSAFLFVLFLATAAHADPLVITGGTAEIVRTSIVSSTQMMDVTGAGLRVSGSGNLERPPLGCSLCANGQTSRFSESFTGSNEPSGAFSHPPTFGLVVGGMSYNWPDFRTFVDIGIVTPLTTIIVPPGEPQTFTIVVPFAASGSYRIDSNATFQLVGSGTLTGQGLAEVLLRRDGVTSLYVTQSVTYRFQNPAATPEPATLTLLGLGTGGAWLLRRRCGNKR